MKDWRPESAVSLTEPHRTLPLPDDGWLRPRVTPSQIGRNDSGKVSSARCGRLTQELRGRVLVAVGTLGPFGRARCSQRLGQGVLPVENDGPPDDAPVAIVSLEVVEVSEALLALENELNHRPRMVLNDDAPAELFAALLASKNP